MKNHTLKKKACRVALSTALVAGFGVQAATLTWSSGGNWNTTDANWTGLTWNNGTPDDAVFNTDTGAIALTEAISAGSFTFGLNNANTSGSFSGSPLVISGDLLAQADGNNGPGGPTLSFSNNVTVGGDLRIGRRVVEITGGTFSANRVLSADSWGRLLISGGTVTATNGIDDSINGGNTMSIVLFGGSLYTPYIKTTSAGFTTLPNDGVVLSGGTLFATADSSDFIQTYQDPFNWGDRNNVGVGPGGANINTGGFSITITKALQDYAGAGVLNKSGAGTLTLQGYNSTTGGTTINGGTLEAARSQQDHGIHTLGSGPLVINNGGTLRSTAQWSTSSEWNGWATVGSITINQGGTWAIEAVGQTVYNGLNLNGGAVTATTSHGDWGALHLKSNVAAGGGVVSSIDADTALDGSKTITVENGSQLNYSGVIHNQFGTAGAIAKAGAGTLVLSGNNTYTGDTTVMGGTLLIHGTHTGGGLITVDAGATLGGNGTVGNVEVADGGILSPGASAGHLTVNDLTLNPASVLNIELGAPTLAPNSGSDFVTVNNMLTLGGTLNILALPGFGTPVGGESWLVMTANNGIADNGIVIGSTPALAGGLSFALEYSSGVDVFLNVVPEAGTAGLFGLALLILRRVRGVKTAYKGK